MVSYMQGKDPGLLDSFIARTYPAVGKARPRPRIFYQFSYRYTIWVSTELVKIYPEKSDFYQQTLNLLLTYFSPTVGVSACVS
jgi:hypothetical protein